MSLSSLSIDGRETPLQWRAVQFALMLAAHAALIAWLVSTQFRPAPEPELIRMTVRTVDAPTPVPPRPIVEPPRPLAPRPKPIARAAPPPTPAEPAPKPAEAPPILTAAPSPEPAPAPFTVAPQPAPLEEPSAPPSPAPSALPIVAMAPRFDAAYLHNPAPDYPHASRRSGETGKVLLNVRVSAQGVAEQVQIAKSSGFPRLDEAAREAVRRWRFVPARRGDEAIAANVIVPIVFQMDQ